MAWPERKLSSWNEFLNLAEQVGATRRPFSTQILCRGMANAAWKPQASLHRTLSGVTDPAEAVRVELECLESFKKAASLWPGVDLPAQDGDLMAWWAVMQHHGAPTRLIDWTASPFVAAYFAVEQGWDVDGAIWLFEALPVIDAMRKSRDQLIKTSAIPAAWWPNESRMEDQLLQDPKAPMVVMPSGLGRYWAPRMVSQQGQFTMCVNVLGDHHDLIEATFAPMKPTAKDLKLLKLVIPAELKPRFLHYLHSMNVTASALIPTIDGFGKSITAQAQLEAARVMGKL
jgi:hypothetical protein